MSGVKDAQKIHATTVRVPAALYAQATAVMEAGYVEASTFNDLVVDSLKEKLRAIRESSIDAQFAQMRSDLTFREHSQQIANEFAQSDWEALDRKG